MNRPPVLRALVLGLTSSMLSAAEPVVFASAFATGEKAGIHAFVFDTQKGQLKPLSRSTGVQNPFFIALSPDKKFLYAIDAEKFGGTSDEFVAAFAIEGRGGNLRLINRQSTRGGASCFLEVDPAGKTVLVANYKTGSVASLPVREDGSLGEAVSFFQHSGSGGDAKRQKGPNAHSLVVSPDGKYALAADLGIDKILVYGLDSGSGKISPHATQPSIDLAPGSGPRHLIFSPAGNHVYVINELANTIAVFDWSPALGTLKQKQTIPTLPADFSGKSYTADVKMTPDGRYLYGTNRGHDSIACYRVGENGLLTLTGIESSRGKGPQNLLISPDGRWLLCANMPGNGVMVFGIEAATGAITSRGEPTEVPMASCLRWME